MHTIYTTDSEKLKPIDKFQYNDFSHDRLLTEIVDRINWLTETLRQLNLVKDVTPNLKDK